jgi:hypothetical protein
MMTSYTNTMDMSSLEDDTYCSDFCQSDSEEEYEDTGASYMLDGDSAYDSDFVNPVGSFGSHGMKFDDAFCSGFRGPMNLASEISQFETMAEMVKWYADKAIREALEAVAKEMAIAEAEQKAHEELMESIPTMSKAGLEKAQKAKAIREMAYRKNSAAVAYAVRKAKAARPSGNLFGHRRNGGKRKKTFACVKPEVMAKRRTDARVRRKKEKVVEAENNLVAQAATKIETDTSSVSLVKLSVIETKTEEEIEEAKEEDSALRAIQAEILKGQDERVAKETAEREEMVEAAYQKKLKEAAIKAEEEAEAATWSKAKTKKKPSAKKVPLVIKMGAASAKPIRMDACDMLETSESLQTTRLYTQMCKSVAKNTRCLHGTKCRFAHDASLLRKSVCVYGQSCKFVKCQNGVWENKVGKKKKCVHYHHKESEENHKARMEAPLVSREEARKAFYNKPTVFSIPTPTPVVISNSKSWVVPEAVTIDQPKTWVAPAVDMKACLAITPVVEKVEKVEKTVATPKKQLSSIELEGGETILRVPASMAAMALDIAIRSGKTNIRIEIITLAPKAVITKWSKSAPSKAVTLTSVIAEEKVKAVAQKAVDEEKKAVEEVQRLKDAKRAKVTAQRRNRKKQQRANRTPDKKPTDKHTKVTNRDGWTTVNTGVAVSKNKVVVDTPMTVANFWSKLE